DTVGAGRASKMPIAWNGIETFGLLDAPGAPGVNRQLEGTRMTKRKRRHRRSVDIRINWLQPHVEGFKNWLAQRKYTPATTAEVVRLLALWGDWVRTSGFELETLVAGFTASASVFGGSKTARAPQGAAALFIAYLREKNVLPPEQHPSLEETWPALAAFRRWMREQRGIQDSTLNTYQEVLVDLLAALGTDPTAYTAAAIRGFVLDRARPHGRGRAQGITVATRAYLKYLVAVGQCPIGREHAVPTFASWQLATTPRFLGQADIDRLLAACGGEDHLRDRAVILLLARLGLRASEVANLSFGDIDWEDGRITLVGKTRREERLPLTQEIGDAILAYIEQARPRIATARVFLTQTAPVRPIGRIAVKCIVRRALDRAGIDSPHRGAHVLRHSAATAMLRGGASLAGVGAVLRHRSPSVTALYAKVDIGLLSEIAQPWGGRLPC
ncbi:tyrosine-type recombinase/integrase, partial [Xanthobacter flavus]|uniref:tyrosine-type recombinase/integrase n=1 Tax=Xanthobacter flavus TaxID=281 RepID=UPI00372BAD21